MRFTPPFFDRIRSTLAGQSWRFLPGDFKERSHFGVERDMPLAHDDTENFIKLIDCALFRWRVVWTFF